MISIRRLVWNSWNVAHNARHNVTPDEVEEVCHGKYIVRQTYDNRLLLIGPTLHDRTLAIVLGPTEEADTYYAVTARPASKRERRLYKNESR
jgi:uncharacterized DUF497 family protein